MGIYPSGFDYGEYYLYSEKGWEVIPLGTESYTLASGVKQNAPIVITASGYEINTRDDPWARVDGSGKYEKVGYGYFATLSDGSYDTRYKQFALVPDAAGELIFNQPLPELVYVEYETGISGYYILDTLDLNPAIGHLDSGFFDYSSITDPQNLFLITTQSALRADTNDYAKLTASVFDVDFNKTEGITIIFELQNVNEYSNVGYLIPYLGSATRLDGSGLTIEVQETTDVAGRAHVRYYTIESQVGAQIIKAYYQDSSGIYDTVLIGQSAVGEAVGSGFVLDHSLLNSDDYLV